MLRALYDWTMRLAAHRRAQWTLAFVSFIESSVFPIPPDALLVPMTLANPRRAWRYATICTIASVLGGLAGYAIGLWLFDLMEIIIEFYGMGPAKVEFQDQFLKYGAEAVFFAGLTPFPYKVITLMSGAMSLPLGVFIAASVVSRGMRFYMVCGLLYFFGEPVRLFIERYLGLVTLAAGTLLVGGFVAVKYLL